MGIVEDMRSRNFYSDSPYRYAKPDQYALDPSHGRVDIPHAVIYLGYDFGKGWSLQTEIEFEHTGTGTAFEREYEEAAEWESEIEKGGEVELEQFWIQKSFFPQLNVRVGHIIVPVGGLNNAHEPLNFFNVYRPEGEYTILPSTWHDTGISIWGQAGGWRYEAMVVAFNGIMGVAVPSREASENLRDVSLVVLYPAVFLLTFGTFLGAVWANISWGSYWAWDPKETWALVTMLVYSFTLHGGVLKPFRSPRFFHWYTIGAFICVLITYFGVNLILGGMHSYA